MTRTWRVVVLAACLFVVASSGRAQQAIDFGRYYALVIGINDYKNLPRLETAVNDASTLHDLLSREFGFRSTLLLNPTRYAMVRALDRMRRELTQDDNLLIFYAGHGVLDQDTDRGYWLPVDAEKDSQANWVSVSTVTDTLQAMSAQHVLIVADSCYSGALTRDAPVVLTRGQTRQAELNRLSEKRARKVMTSGGLEPVNDSGGDGHSVFTRALLETLKGTDEPTQGFELFTQVRRAVVVNAEQTPQYADIRLAGDGGGDFVFVPRAARRVVAAVDPTATGVQSGSQGPNQDAIDLAFWSSVKDSRNPAAFDAYLRKFPNGNFAVLAKLKRDLLLGENGGGRDSPEQAKDDPIEQAFWDSVKDSASPRSLEAYLKAYPDGRFVALARVRIQELNRPADTTPPAAAESEPTAAVSTQRELAAWNAVKDSNDIADFQRFLDTYPDGRLTLLVEARIDELRARQRQAATVVPVEPPRPELLPVETEFIAQKNTNVRNQPGLSGQVIHRLERGARVYVIGKVRDADWLAVELENQEVGYVYAALLEDAGEVERQMAAEEAARRAVEAAERNAVEEAAALHAAEEAKRVAAEEAAARAARETAERQRLARAQADSERLAREAAERSKQEEARRLQMAAIELAFWRTVEAADTLADFERYLAAYPNGGHADQARAALERLRPRIVTLTPPAAPPRAEPKAPTGHWVGMDCRLEFDLYAKDGELRGQVWRITDSSADAEDFVRLESFDVTGRIGADGRFHDVETRGSRTYRLTGTPERGVVVHKGRECRFMLSMAGNASIGLGAGRDITKRGGGRQDDLGPGEVIGAGF